MSLFAKTKSSAADFKERSEEILGVFTTTKNKLVALVQEQVSYKESIESEIASLKIEANSVSVGITENNAVITKITDFLN
jgi:hypothetical protein